MLLRGCWSRTFYRHFTDEMGDFLVFTFRCWYTTYMLQILHQCNINTNASASGTISTKNVEKMKIIEYYWPSRKRAHAEIRLLVSPSNHSGHCCVLPRRAWHMGRPYCDWKTKLDTSISSAVTGLVIVVYTLCGDFLCNRFSENSLVFEKLQRIGVRSSLTCVFQKFLYLTGKVLLSSWAAILVFWTVSNIRLFSFFWCF